MGIIPISLCFVVGIIFFVKALTDKREAKSSDDFKPSTIWTVVAPMAFIAAIIPPMIQYPTNIERVAYMTSFYRNNTQAYEVAADRTASYLSQDKFIQELESKFVAGSLEKMQLANIVSQRITEWRDGVVAYNQIMETYKRLTYNPWTGILIPRIPDDVKPLAIK